VKEGEEAGLSAEVKDIADGNMVTFQVWKEGQDPAVHIAQAQIPAGIEGGVAKGKWLYRLPGDAELPEQDPKWYFTVHSAWCRYKESGNLTVELKRPEITDLKWEAITYDEQGNETGKEEVSEIEYGKSVVLSAKIKNLEDGDRVNLLVSEEGHTGKTDYLFETPVQIHNGAIETRFIPKMDRMRLENIKDGDSLSLVFTIACRNGTVCKESQSVAIVFSMYVKYKIKGEQISEEDSYTLTSSDKAYRQTLNESNDIIPGDEYVTLKFTGIKPGKMYSLIYKNGKTGKEVVRWENIPFAKIIGAGKNGDK
jgi:hypothetical protein